MILQNVDGWYCLFSISFDLQFQNYMNKNSDFEKYYWIVLQIGLQIDQASMLQLSGVYCDAVVPLHKLHCICSAYIYIELHIISSMKMSANQAVITFAVSVLVQSS